ncbi:hypothetical protein GWG65_17350 [Bradyrhizobium sp. CSA207]|uniref:hypothetical protein n=1 Tax=Bradyrhizobium sp. CSA207 TaxID=2698826 RepID=UPI0023AFA7C3|nr:hypothetical protein [Bradyrhizobium sp. CSA207]MDE5443187.1 hypothetical protein [Bradyrhizobium sp. CSA207]
MNEIAGDGRPSIEAASPQRSQVGIWVTIAVLGLLLIASAVIAYVGWTISDAAVPDSGYVAMGFGVLFSLLVGIGLMALIFYSSRKGYDEPAVLIEEPGANFDDVQKPSSK